MVTFFLIGVGSLENVRQEADYMRLSSELAVSKCSHDETAWCLDLFVIGVEEDRPNYAHWFS